MTRLLWAALFLGALLGQEKQEKPKPQDPPEEDETLAAKEYSFNPLQAQRELKTGHYYFRKGSYKAAALRFQEAVKWNPGLAEAYLRLGEVREKLKDPDGARQAFAKYLELAPDARNASAIRKKLAEKRQ